MKILGFVFGVCTLLFLGYLTLFTRSALEFAGSSPSVNTAFTYTLFIITAIMVGTAIAATRRDSPSNFYPKRSLWIYVAAIVFSVTNIWWTNIFVFDRIFDARMIFESLLFGPLFVGVPAATAILCIAYPFRNASN